jgi:hypothetical protein
MATPIPLRDYVPSNLWRTQPQAVESFREIVNNQTFQSVLRTVSQESPLRQQESTVTVDQNPQTLANAAMLETGYNLCLNKILEMAVLAKPEEDGPLSFPDETFEPDEEWSDEEGE